MRKRHAIAIAAALAVLGQQGSALPQSDNYSANSIMPHCRGASDTRDPTPMQGFCTGVISTIYFFGDTHLGACPPKGTNIGQAIRVVVRYIDQRPERMHEKFMTLALEALQQAWPCRR
jgi:hypothetical protein